MNTTDSEIIFNEKEVDELTLLNIEATILKKEPNYSWIKDIVSESFMPIGYGEVV